MKLHRDDLETLIQLIDKLDTPDGYVTLEEDNSSGIGFIIYAHFFLEVNGVKGKFTQTLVDESNW